MHDAAFAAGAQLPPRALPAATATMVRSAASRRDGIITRKERCGCPRTASRRAMILLYITIPIMVLAVAIATVPLLVAMRAETRIERSSRRLAPQAPAGTDEVPLAA